MAIRKSKEENFTVNDTVDNLLLKSQNALSKGGFKKINTNNLLNQITADYKTFTVIGSIIVTIADDNGKSRININSTANADNIFALFSSPNQKILDQFKNNL
jgi:hypothetical protein